MSWTVCALSLAMVTAGCSSSGEAPDGSDQAAQPRFDVPADATAGGPPDLNSVPTAAPTPRSTPSERRDALEGLVADRANAQHLPQGARTQPVVVRPLQETASDAAPPEQAEAPPEPDTSRLDAPPPARPAEAAPIPGTVPGPPVPPIMPPRNP